MTEKFWQKDTWTTIAIALVYVIAAIGIGSLIAH